LTGYVAQRDPRARRGLSSARLAAEKEKEATALLVAIESVHTVCRLVDDELDMLCPVIELQPTRCPSLQQEGIKHIFAKD
jgi:hypothetical protein